MALVAEFCRGCDAVCLDFTENPPKEVRDRDGKIRRVVEKLLHCTKCKAAYCSKDCQKLDWKNHKISCSKVGHEDFNVSRLVRTFRQRECNGVLESGIPYDFLIGRFSDDADDLSCKHNGYSGVLVVKKREQQKKEQVLRTQFPLVVTVLYHSKKREIIPIASVALCHIHRVGLQMKKAPPEPVKVYQTQFAVVTNGRIVTSSPACCFVVTFAEKGRVGLVHIDITCDLEGLSAIAERFTKPKIVIIGGTQDCITKNRGRQIVGILKQMPHKILDMSMMLKKPELVVGGSKLPMSQIRKMYYYGSVAIDAETGETSILEGVQWELEQEQICRNIRNNERTPAGRFAGFDFFVDFEEVKA
ncbi:MAG: hypothetical protein S4CHLAM81_13170 [Chlamydiales bacterium]|nr:hypothetical protein [Chlamydiales bacterium]MCH9636089.1 hypothetical protein [Chlamydiales bacterium]MCH9703154.1 zinc finger MYND domain-containing protein [Chlamydiota bacterium]